MFAIKVVGQDIWAGKKDITWFIADDLAINFRAKNLGKPALYLNTQFGVPMKRRRIFSSTDEIRRSLQKVAKESVVVSGNTQSVFGTIELIADGPNLGSFSAYEVVEITTGSVYSLNDVLSKKI
jgi:hypothetical protein